MIHLPTYITWKQRNALYIAFTVLTLTHYQCDERSKSSHCIEQDLGSQGTSHTLLS